MNALDFLIAPCDRDEFLTTFWERSPALITGRSSTYFESLFSIYDLGDLLSREALFHPAVQVFLSGRQLQASEYTTIWSYGRESHRLIDCDQILKLFDDGATINIVGLERMHERIQQLNFALERESGFPVHTTGFLTPRNAGNIPAHYDEVDFFVLQAAGEKIWRLWRSDRRLPLVKGGDRTYASTSGALSNDNLICEHILRPGDTLFVPRGIIHQTFTEDETSFHITVGINPHRRLDALSVAVNHTLSDLAHDVRFRRSYPMPGSVAHEMSKTLTETFEELRTELFKNCEKSLETAFDALDRGMLAGRYQARRGQLLDLDSLPQVSGGSLLRRRPELFVQTSSIGDKLLVKFQGKTLYLPAEYARWIADLELGHRLTVSQLVDESDTNGMEDIRRLIAEGYLTLAAA